jgi:RNA polymerase sigma-70 factor (ECF subfamily)
MHELNDTILLQKIRDGSEKAFKVVYDRYHIQLFYIAKKYLKDTGLSEDAVQDIFVKLWEKKHKLNDIKSLKAYLFTMLRNRVLNMLRDKKSDVVSMTSLTEKTFPAQNLTEDDLQYKEYERVLQRGINELSDRKREVFELRSQKGFTNPEVAEMLQVDVRTVKTHYYNGSKYIRAYLSKHSGILTFLFASSQAILLKF